MWSSKYAYVHGYCKGLCIRPLGVWFISKNVPVFRHTKSMCVCSMNNITLHAFTNYGPKPQNDSRIPKKARFYLTGSLSDLGQTVDSNKIGWVARLAVGHTVFWSTKNPPQYASWRIAGDFISTSNLLLQTIANLTKEEHLLTRTNSRWLLFF